MSRIGNAPIAIPNGVTIKTSGQVISAKGPKGELSFEVHHRISFKVEDNTLTFERPTNNRLDRSLHGTARARTANIVHGVHEGWSKTLEINGVGYRAAAKGKTLDLTLGFSHPISYVLPEGVKAEVAKDGKVTVSGPDKIAVGKAAADIRGYRPPEPYKGKGVKYVGEHIIRKEGKRGKK
ncbi:MAG: 50S ribosomal protein L6 [Nannocystales bacterium]